MRHSVLLDIPDDHRVRRAEFREEARRRALYPTGKPDPNAYIEPFNRSYCTEVLNAYLFESIAELRALTDQWLRVYNQERPHDSLGRVPPLAFLPMPTTAGLSPWKLSA